MKLLPTYAQCAQSHGDVLLYYIAAYGNKLLVGMCPHNKVLRTFGRSYGPPKHFICNGIGHKKLTRITL